MSLYDRAALARALDVSPDDLEELTADGIAHAHVRVRGRGQLVRIPRFSQVASDPRAHLDYQAACFARAEPAGVTPLLEAVLAPAAGLPMGGLVVEEIVGRVPDLARDLPAVAAALASLHGLAVPPPAERRPLVDHAADPLEGARAHLARQAVVLEDPDDATVLAPAARTILREELADLMPRLDALRDAPQPAGLIAFDCHPGNFIIEPTSDWDGRAVLVDLERMQYGAPASDLAHATLPTSTLWDRRIDVVLPRPALEGFYRDYRRALDPVRAAQLRPFLAPFRRLIFLRSTTWFVRFLGETRAGRWSAGSLDPAFLAEVERRIRRLLEPAHLDAMRAEWRGRDPFDPAALF